MWLTLTSMPVASLMTAAIALLIAGLYEQALEMRKIRSQQTDGPLLLQPFLIDENGSVMQCYQSLWYCLRYRLGQFIYIFHGHTNSVLQNMFPNFLKKINGLQ